MIFLFKNIKNTGASAYKENYHLSYGSSGQKSMSQSGDCQVSVL